MFRNHFVVTVICVSVIISARVDAAAAQPSNAVTLESNPDTTPTESVTVLGVKNISPDVINDFVQAYATPTRSIGKIARWVSGICPQTIGLAPKFANFMSQRVKTVAQMVGAPIDSSQSCKENVDIVFTTNPQALLDNIRAHQPIFLGYHDNDAQAQEMAKFTHPIQAWYTTQTADLHGKVEIDNPKSGGVEFTMLSPPPAFTGQMSGPIQGYYTLHLPYASGLNVAASRLGDGLSSAYYHVIIVADPNKLREYEIGSLADYIAMLSLAQPQSLDTCQPLPTIINLLAPDCEGSNVTNAISSADIAYLSGLYKITLDGTLRQQRDEISYQMRGALASH